MIKQIKKPKCQNGHRETAMQIKAANNNYLFFLCKITGCKETYATTISKSLQEVETK